MLKQGLCKLTSFTPRKIKITGLKLKSPGKGKGSKFHFFIKSLILNPEGFLKLVSIYLYNEIRENR